MKWSGELTFALVSLIVGIILGFLKEDLTEPEPEDDFDECEILG